MVLAVLRRERALETELGSMVSSKAPGKDAEVIDTDATRRDETLRRMLTTPRPAAKPTQAPPGVAKPRSGASAKLRKLAPTGEAS